MNQDRIFNGTFIKKNGRLVFRKKEDQAQFDLLSKGMREGQSCDISIDFSDDLGRLSQISKLKAGIRDISRETGEVYITEEKQIKKDAGLYDEVRDEYKSFGNCSISQLSDAIHVMLERFAFLGMKDKR